DPLHIEAIAHYHRGCADSGRKLLERACQIVGVKLVKRQVSPRTRGAAHLCAGETEALRGDEAGYLQNVRNVLIVVPFVEFAVPTARGIGQHHEDVSAHRYSPREIPACTTRR